MMMDTPLAKISKASLILRFTVIGAVIVAIAGLFLYAGGWFTPHKLSPDVMINTFEHVNGSHPGFRRNHARASVSAATSRAMVVAPSYLRRRFSCPVACRSSAGLHWPEASLTSRMQRIPFAAWRCCSNCRTVKNGASALTIFQFSPSTPLKDFMIYCWRQRPTQSPANPIRPDENFSGRTS